MESSTQVPAPPWMDRRPVRRVRKPTASPLSRESIVQAALALVDKDGLEALTVRRLGEQLGVTMMALYWHVRDKAQLLDLVGEAALREIALPDRTGDWVEDMRRLMREARAGLHRHPNAAALAFGRARYGPSGLQMFERILAILADAGFDDAAAGLAYMALYTFLRGNWSSEASAQADPASLVEYREYLASLPAGRFPRAAVIGPQLFRRNPDDFFEYGLDVVLVGLARRLDAATVSAPDAAGPPGPTIGALT
jgi:AcrR family transcriptional regulator